MEQEGQRVEVSFRITVGDITLAQMDVPLNENMDVLTGLEVSVKGVAIGEVRTSPADTDFVWKTPAPIVTPQKAYRGRK